MSRDVGTCDGCHDNAARYVTIEARWLCGLCQMKDQLGRGVAAVRVSDIPQLLAFVSSALEICRGDGGRDDKQASAVAAVAKIRAAVAKIRAARDELRLLGTCPPPADQLAALRRLWEGIAELAMAFPVT